MPRNKRYSHGKKKNNILVYRLCQVRTTCAIIGKSRVTLCLHACFFSHYYRAIIIRPTEFTTCTQTFPSGVSATFLKHRISRKKLLLELLLWYWVMRRVVYWLWEVYYADSFSFKNTRINVSTKWLNHSRLETAASTLEAVSS